MHTPHGHRSGPRKPGDHGRADESRPLVLLAEDNDDSRRVYGLILRHYGYRVEEADNGIDAIELTRARRPAMVLMDIGLPRLDGWAAAMELKRDPSTRAIPVIAFSASIDSPADLNGATRVFDGFVRKPISPTELAERVGEYIADLRDAAQRALDLSFEDAEDPDAQLSA